MRPVEVWVGCDDVFPEARVSQLLESCYLVQGGTGVVEECHRTELREEEQRWELASRLDQLRA